MSALLERTAVVDDTFNLRLWKKICSDRDLAHLPHKIETNELGQIVMMPPPGRFHGKFQADLALELRNHAEEGKVLGEFGISTSKGVKGPDAGWCSQKRWDAQGDSAIFLSAPEICVEVASPTNTEAELNEKKLLYFDEGAEEVWIVSTEGELSFYLKGDPGRCALRSAMCPAFPARL